MEAEAQCRANECWKQRHSVEQTSVAGEERDVCQEILESWRERVKELIRGFEPADMWNQDETGTMWKALPEKSLAERSKRCRGGKNAKQKITAAFFVNAVGGKETPILIGSSKKPRCFANLLDTSRPCGADNFSNDKAWMKSDIMINVLTKLNNKLKRTD
ncbi:tigger transposable element-derived protein 6-like [Montipora foliosa]|uniref:tigger transposable element-derived protein 6-like n=1 Tax=Montipora foliosa TaxID=591990 RepID=UPI0035F175B0